MLTDEQLADFDDERPMELPYDDDAAEAMGPSLASRINKQKVYLLEESAAVLHARLGKRKHPEDDGEDADVEMMDEDDSHRPNALFVSGKPIANLPTQRIFAYAAHFDVVPLGLEWVDDTSCVLLFKSRAGARQALESLAKNADEDRLDGSREARSVPLSLWPMESRIHSVLGKSAGGADEPLRIRWAEISDVKKRGAHRASQFYKKHGETAGREVYVDGVLVLPPPRTDSEATSARPAQRRRIDSDTQRAELDAELDAFLNGEDTGKEPFRDRDHDRSSRSGRTQVPIRRSSRSASPARRDGGDRNGRGRPRREERSERRPHKTQEQLDAELEEFLAGRA